MTASAVPTAQLDALARRDHPEPHAVLGAHPGSKDGKVVVRALRPAAQTVTVHPADGAPVELTQIHPAGIFEGELTGELPLRYELEVDYGPGGTFRISDPYAFLPTLGELDLHLMGEGRHEAIYDKLGAHVREIDAVAGTAFAVWAPAARSVSVVGDFDSWDGRIHPMRSMGTGGIWELFIPGVGAGQNYKYEIKTTEGELLLKADPFAQETEIPPKTASVIVAPQHQWSTADADWLKARASQQPLGEAMSIYEVHLGSWRLNSLEDNRSLTYEELADELSAYALDLGFTHIELLPVMAHPFSGSWGYQVTGYYAPTPNYGSPDDMRAFVDRLHSRGLGVILDWVPAHFPRDQFALARFDGTALYEHDDPRRGAHPDWGTLVFNFGRRRGGATSSSATPCSGCDRVPRRRPARGRGGLDALPRLFAQGRGRVDCPTSSAAARTSTRPVPQEAQRGDLRPRRVPRDPHDRRGVDQPGRASRAPRTSAASASA